MVTPREVLAQCREKSVRAVDLWFTDLPGRWQRFTLPVQQLDEDLFEQGFAGASSHLGIAEAESEGMVLFVPQPDTAFIDPTASQPTLGLVCSITTPYTGEESPWDARHVAMRAVSYLAVAGGAQGVDVGWSLDYYLFRAGRGVPRRWPATLVRDDLSQLGFEALGYDAEATEATESVALSQADAVSMRHQLAQAMAVCRFPLAVQHSLSCAAGQSHLDVLPQPLVRAADGVMVVKHFARQLARAQGLQATFMPQPLFGSCGSGWGVQLAIRDHDRAVFAGSGYAGLSDTALYAIGGLLRHAPSLAAFTNPSTNSFRRLASHPLIGGYSQRPQAMVHVPNYQASPAAKRIVYRVPDATANPYLALAAMVMAMADGIQNKISPGKPVEQTEGAGNGGQARPVTLPADLNSALEALSADHDYLLRGEAFSTELVQAWIRHKQSVDVTPLRSRPHPHEYSLYFDC